MKRALIFVSCGQVTEDEKKLGAEVCKLIEELTPYEPYFAQNQTTLLGLSENILGALNRSSGLLAIMHPRGIVSGPSGDTHTRASVWIEQEIAIAAFLMQAQGRKLPVLAYIHRDIEREGVRDKLLLNPQAFESNDEILGHLRSTLPTWKVAPQTVSTDSSSADERIAAVFKEEKPLVPRYVGEADNTVVPTHAYQTWMVRSRQSLILKLDRAIETSVTTAIDTHFKSDVPRYLAPPRVTADSHVIRWQAHVVGGGKSAGLTYVRYVEVTSEGALRYCEKIDRHETRREQESFPDQQKHAVAKSSSRAGSGKTTTLTVIRSAAERQGYQVEGFAPTSRAGRQLANSTTQELNREPCKASSPALQIPAYPSRGISTLSMNRALPAPIRCASFFPDLILMTE